MNGDRRYIAVSIKHSEYRWKFGDPLVMWGYHRTADDEERCFADYTIYPDKAERYALGDFTAHGYNQYGAEIVKEDKPVKIEYGFCRKWKEWDTVLVDEEDIYTYYRAASLPMEVRKG